MKMVGGLDKSRQAVVVGLGRYTQRRPVTVEESLTPVELAAAAAKRAGIDTGVEDPEGLLKDAVALATIGMFLETRWIGVFKEKPFTNFSKSLADKLGAKPLHLWRSFPGGNGPQFLVNTFAGMIANGEIEQGPILLGGCEANATFDRAVRDGQKDKLRECGWDDRNQKDKPKTVNRQYRLNEHVVKALRQEVGVLTNPIRAYAMFENAYQHSRGLDTSEGHQKMARLFSKFSLVAAAQPEHSWYPESRTVEDLLSPDNGNRMLAYPYRKNIVARDEVDQSAMVVMMSWAEAERRGIPREKMLFLWGSGDAYDSEVLSIRKTFSRSLSMEAAYEEAFRSAGLNLKGDGPEKIAVYDIYSCFPIAVELACETLGFDTDTVDVARITATGGLPYHGGPGSNYSTHGLCALGEKLRSDYYRGQLGMVAANGGLLTEHSVGIYSTEPPPKTFARRDFKEYAPQCGLSYDRFVEQPNGEARILLWSCLYKRKPNLPNLGYIVGEMSSGPDKGKRFSAATKKGDNKTIEWLLAQDRTDETVLVTCTGEIQKGSRFDAYVVTFTPLPQASL